jgi:hypothetical protein
MDKRAQYSLGQKPPGKESLIMQGRELESSGRRVYHMNKTRSHWTSVSNHYLQRKAFEKAEFGRADDETVLVNTTYSNAR